MSKEIVDIYDENLKKIGSISREEAHNQGKWHKSIHCWIIRTTGDGYVLFQKRGRDKKLFPNYLDISSAGHYTSGETAKDGVREILEELGIDVKFNELIPLGIKMDIAKVGNILNREFCDVFFLKKPESPKDYNLDPSEVEGLVQIKIEDGLQLFSSEKQIVKASGIEWEKESNSWNEIEFDAGIDSFIPRVDPYYYKIFIMAKLAMSESKYLSI